MIVGARVTWRDEPDQAAVQRYMTLHPNKMRHLIDDLGVEAAFASIPELNGREHAGLVIAVVRDAAHVALRRTPSGTYVDDHRPARWSLLVLEGNKLVTRDSAEVTVVTAKDPE